MSRPVLSAADVRAARRRRETRLAVPAGAIVTPLARDEAARWGIELLEERAGSGTPAAGGPSAAGSSGAPSGSPRSATCDPSDLDRLVERVRARVPGADPAQVREIARRVLERLG
ncbi:MAG TPA: hypothetical protein VM778_01525 [Gemmatimonadota bacterium]|nr:hypothetical protein [Gemmatimonadota bacterium]